jgi:hypothetical protein
VTPEEAKAIRAEVIRELDAKYNAMCERKVNGAIEQMEIKLKEAEQLNWLNSESIRRGRARNMKLEAVAMAAAYCYRHGHIDQAAVTFTGLDKHLNALEGKNEQNVGGSSE